jgi:hypothetical protein
MAQSQDIKQAAPIMAADEYESQFQAWWRDFTDDWRQRYPSVEPPPLDKARVAFAAAWARSHGQRRRAIEAQGSYFTSSSKATWVGRLQGPTVGPSARAALSSHEPTAA